MYRAIFRNFTSDIHDVKLPPVRALRRQTYDRQGKSFHLFLLTKALHMPCVVF